MNRVVEMYEECTDLVHVRHPWAGKLVFTAFSVLTRMRSTRIEAHETTPGPLGSSLFADRSGMSAEITRRSFVSTTSREEGRMSGKQLRLQLPKPRRTSAWFVPICPTSIASSNSEIFELFDDIYINARILMNYRDTGRTRSMKTMLTSRRTSDSDGSMAIRAPVTVIRILRRNRKSSEHQVLDHVVS